MCPNNTSVKALATTMFGECYSLKKIMMNGVHRVVIG